MKPAYNRHIYVNHTMKKLLFIPIVLAIVANFMTSCDDDVTNTGSSLITDKSEIIVDSLFNASGQSVRATSVQSRTLTQLIGRLQAKEFGSLSSEIVTQFMPAMSLDTVGTSANDIESMEMLMFFNTGSFTGDSLTPMGLRVYPLIKQLPSPIYSDFDPEGYYDATTPWDSKIYTGNVVYNDSLNNLSYRTIRVSLPLDFAKKFYDEYITNPSTFSSPSAFTKFFPGIYIKNTFGDGRITNIRETRINMSYKRHATYTKNDTLRDTIYHITRSYMSVTPEIVTNNIIKLSLSDRLSQMVQEGSQILVAPVGYDIEMRFPLPEIIKSYKEKAGQLAVVNTLTMSIPAAEISNSYSINPPERVLIVLKKDKAEFFAKNKLTDDKTSFLATYNKSTKTYEISGMRQYFLDMLAKDAITEEDYMFTITPVDVTTETTQGSYYQQAQTYITAIAPYVSGPAMVKLDIDNAKIKLTFGKQSAIF